MSVEKLTLELIMVSGAQKDIFLSFVDSTFYMEIQSHLCEPLGTYLIHTATCTLVVETSVFLGRP